MTLTGERSLWTVRALTVAVAASLAGCAALGPVTPVAVTDITSVAGKWEGVVYGPGAEEDYVELTIREDGSYDAVSRGTYGASRGNGKIVVRDGRLILHGQKGTGVATVAKSPSGDRIMTIAATLSDNSTLSASLSPSPGR
jgi:hypothetical protein